MIARLYLEYFLLVFAAALGVLQATVTYNKLVGLSFFRRKVCGYIFATLTILSALIGFFTWNFRNAAGVVEGAQQFGFFAIAVIAAIILTLVLSSLLKHSKVRGNNAQHDGLEAFKDITFFQILQQRFGRKR
jgi:uncharacterized membrane protein